jgi:hypothetical protein
MPYEEGQRAGRILLCCRTCRVEHSRVDVSIPIEWVDADLFVDLHEQGFTESEPDFAAEIVFGEERSEVARRAEEAMGRRKS